MHCWEKTQMYLVYSFDGGLMFSFNYFWHLEDFCSSFESRFEQFSTLKTLA